MSTALPSTTALQQPAVTTQHECLFQDHDSIHLLHFRTYFPSPENSSITLATGATNRSTTRSFPANNNSSPAGTAHPSSSNLVNLVSFTHPSPSHPDCSPKRTPLLSCGPSHGGSALASPGRGHDHLCTAGLQLRCLVGESTGAAKGGGCGVQGSWVGCFGGSEWVLEGFMKVLNWVEGIHAGILFLGDKNDGDRSNEPVRSDGLKKVHKYAVVG